MKQVESSVGAVTSLDDELYVALYNSRQIHVYRCDDLHLLRCLPITDLGAQVSSLARFLVLTHSCRLSLQLGILFESIFAFGATIMLMGCRRKDVRSVK